MWPTNSTVTTWRKGTACAIRVANIFLGLSEVGFLSGIQLRATEREQQDDGFECAPERIQLLQTRILQMGFIHSADAGNPGRFFFELRDPVLRSAAFGNQLTVFCAKRDARRRMQQRRSTPGDDGVIERIVGCELQVRRIGIEAGLRD